MVNASKYYFMRRAVIVLSIVLFVFMIIFTWLCVSIYLGYYAQFAPADGVWYCEELELTLSYETGSKSCLIKDGEEILCILSSHKQDKNIDVYEMKNTTQDNGISAQRPGELLFTFKSLCLEDDRLVVRDSSGNKYTFVRMIPEK